MKKIVIISGIILISLCTLVIGLFRVQQERLEGQGFRVDFTKYSIAVFKDNTAEQVLRISPQDDYYYQGTFKDHIVSQETFQRQRNILEEVVFFFGKAFGAKTFRWHTTGENKQWHATVSYGVTATPEGITVNRQFATFPKDIYAIGQTVVICDTCMVVDNLNRMYFNGDSVHTKDLSLLKKQKLTALVLDRSQSIVGVSSLRIVNAAGKTLATLPVYTDQEVFFDHKYHLVELKAIIPVKRTGTFSQNIVLK